MKNAAKQRTKHHSLSFKKIPENATHLQQQKTSIRKKQMLLLAGKHAVAALVCHGTKSSVMHKTALCIKTNLWFLGITPVLCASVKSNNRCLVTHLAALPYHPRVGLLATSVNANRMVQRWRWASSQTPHAASNTEVRPAKTVLQGEGGQRLQN